MLTTNWHPVGDAESAAEAEALEALRALLPDDPLCHAWTNLMFPDTTGHVNEVDLLLLTKQGLFVVELKGWGGSIKGRINDWRIRYPDGQVSIRGNPVYAADKKAKRLKGLLSRLEEEVGTRVRVPYVAPALVMHGRHSSVELSEETKGSVFGLDGFDVKSVPHFTELLKRRPKGSPLDMPTVNALVRLIQNSGLAPRPPREADDRSGGPPGRSPSELVVDLPEKSRPAEPAALFYELTLSQLRLLGVSDEAIGVVARSTDVESLIDRVPDDVWDDLDAVAGGESVDEVVDRRRRARKRFEEAAKEAAAAGWTAPLVEMHEASAQPEPTPAVIGPEPPVMSDVERQLRERFGDHVISSGTTEHRPAQPRVKPSRSSAPAAQPQPSIDEGEEFTVTSESMLQIARSEVVAGRFPAARALHSAVRSALDDTMKVDWTAREVRALRDELAEFLPLARRLDALLNDHASDTPQLVVAGRGPAQIGTLWTGPYLSAVYSLLVRVPDVLDRRSGLFLSQVIGPAAAASINRQLREGRPDGGRIRVADDGTVISRRDPMSPWFVVGRVTPDEWFPTVMLRAA